MAEKYKDIDPQETKEWIESIEDALEEISNWASAAVGTVRIVSASVRKPQRLFMNPLSPKRKIASFAHIEFAALT